MVPGAPPGQPDPRKRGEIVAVDPSSPEARRLWIKLAEFARQFGADQGWCLVGGLMVQLHAFEHDADARPTDDIDVLGDARSRPSGVRRISELLEQLGARLRTPPATDPTLGYQFDIDGETVEVLGPDGLKQGPRTLGNYETIQVEGGTQALRRAEKVTVSVDGGAPVEIRRPALLGAILLKARALDTLSEKREEHREDLIRLLSFVQDPRELAREQRLQASERKWLRSVEPKLDFEDAALGRRFSSSRLERAEQAFELLVR